MMLCVISYWVLSGAKRRQIQQLRCCVLPAKLLKRRDVYNHYVRDGFGKLRISKIKYSDIKKFYYSLILEKGSALFQ